MKIEMGKEYKTRDGRLVRIYATDGGGEFPVHGAILDGGKWVSRTWMSKGQWHGLTGTTDLVEVKPRVKYRVWMNAYPFGSLSQHSSKMLADKARQPHCVACVQVDIDVEEGHGL